LGLNIKTWLSLQLILKSYLLNNKNNIDILTYEKLINKENGN